MFSATMWAELRSRGRWRSSFCIVRLFLKFLAEAAVRSSAATRLSSRFSSTWRAICRLLRGRGPQAGDLRLQPAQSVEGLPPGAQRRSAIRRPGQSSRHPGRRSAAACRSIPDTGHKMRARLSAERERSPERLPVCLSAVSASTRQRPHARHRGRSRPASPCDQRLWASDKRETSRP